MQGHQHTQEARDLIKDLLAEGIFTKREIKTLTGIDFSTMSVWRREGGWEVRDVRPRVEGTPEAAEVVRRANVVVKYIKDMRRVGRWKKGSPGKVPKTISEMRCGVPPSPTACRFVGVDLDRYRSLLSLMKRGFRLIPTRTGYTLRKGGAETTVRMRMANALVQSCLVHEVKRHGQPEYMARRRKESPFERMQRAVDYAIEGLSGGGDGQAGCSFNGGHGPLPSIGGRGDSKARARKGKHTLEAQQS